MVPEKDIGCPQTPISGEIQRFTHKQGVWVSKWSPLLQINEIPSRDKLYQSKTWVALTLQSKV